MKKRPIISVSPWLTRSLRSTFHTDPSSLTILATPVPEEPGGEAVPNICISDMEMLMAFTEEGQGFNAALQFIVRNC
jgi:hypothetical protein